MNSVHAACRAARWPGRPVLIAPRSTGVTGTSWCSASTSIRRGRRGRTRPGTRQKVALVAAFATRAPLLVLDEPTSGLDPLPEREFRLVVAEARARGRAVTRGGEEAGRWDLLAGGRLPLGRLVLRETAVVGHAAGGIGLVVSATLVLAGTPAPGAVVRGVGLGLTGAFFAGVGGLAAQVFPARAAATGAAFGVLGPRCLLRVLKGGSGARHDGGGVVVLGTENSDGPHGGP